MYKIIRKYKVSEKNILFCLQRMENLSKFNDFRRDELIKIISNGIPTDYPDKKIVVRKYTPEEYKKKKKIETYIDDSGNKYRDIIVHTTGQMSPYVMRVDYQDHKPIFENLWQFSKIWPSGPAVKQRVSHYNANLGMRWEHDAFDDHFDGKTGKPTDSYYEWRSKGWKNKRWVRYPTDYKNHPNALGSVYHNPKTGEVEILDYISARKKIYFSEYLKGLKKTQSFKNLKKKYDSGEYIRIIEVDGPKYNPDAYPYNLTKNYGINIDEEILNDLINNPSQAFGHGYCIAAALLEIEDFK